MSLWETTLINLNKGYEKLTLFAAVFSERVKAEIAIVRLRMQIDDVQASIREEHRAIGSKLTELKDDGTLPESFDAFFRSDEVAASLQKLTSLEKTLDGLIDDLGAEADTLKRAPKRKGGENAA